MINRHHAEFIDELHLSLEAFLRDSRVDSDLKSIYRLATAAYSVLRAFAVVENSKLLNGAAGIVRRSAMLCMIRQVSLVRVELRRLIECVIWFGYYVDHPIEYAEFERTPARAWTDDRERPIASIARAETGFFFRYNHERMLSASSRAQRAAAALRTEYQSLSADVHAALGALGVTATLSQAQDPFGPQEVGNLRKQLDRVLTEAVVLVAAADVRLVARLPAIERGWFDWLIGNESAFGFRAGTIGIPR